MQCSNEKCNKEIEDWAFDNKDRDGNLYCMGCQSKIVSMIEIEEENGNR